jgi:hypothetical protein
MSQQTDNIIKISNEFCIQNMLLAAMSYNIGRDLWPDLEQRYEIMQRLIESHKEEQRKQQDA